MVFAVVNSGFETAYRTQLCQNFVNSVIETVKCTLESKSTMTREIDLNVVYGMQMLS